MEGSDQEDKRDFKELKRDRDLVYDSPEQLCGKVWEALTPFNFDSWTLVCFCMVYLLKITVVYEFLKPLAKNLHMTVYLAHYKAPDELGLKPRE